MTAKRNKGDLPSSSFFKALGPSSLRTGPVAVVLSGFLATLAFVAGGFGSPGGSATELREFEVGRVAERDVVADRNVSYVDEEATRLRREAQERLVPAVFRYSQETTRDALTSYSRFRTQVKGLFDGRASAEAFKLAVQAEYPGIFPKETMDGLFRNPSRERFLEYGDSLVRIIMEGGVFALPKSELDHHNPDAVEMVRKSGGRTERERVPYEKMVTLRSAKERIAEIAASGSYPSAFAALAPALVTPFVVENVFFSAEDSAARIEEERSRVEPVVKEIERGDRIIRKGYIVSKDDMTRLGAIDRSRKGTDPGRKAGLVLNLSLVFALFLFLAGPRVVGRRLSRSETYLLTALVVTYVIGSVFAARPVWDNDFLPASLFMPTALVVMLPAVLLGPRVAAAVAVGLPLASFAAGSMDVGAFFFAIASGAAGAYALQGAEKRMDLIKAGFIISVANLAAVSAVLLSGRAPLSGYPPALFWAAFNGMACGMLVLGCLPLLEQALNAATPFRLIELSDLNAPMLKRLLTVAPGTYSHSVTVANLAESACREIGANALLARVGAYYHDIGKMDQPDYFIENQAAYNKHEDLAPRLSATVIRSHVKVGIEKARRLKLPQEVVDIIAEHHGNSIISWFYNEALKREDQVAADDFAYPGSPPRSKESAVVMLADTVEAAVRTLKKPTMSRMEKFVQELIMSKFEQGQLAESELSFRDLETIKIAFVRVLAGHYHSRIEYPKTAREVLS